MCLEQPRRGLVTDIKEANDFNSSFQKHRSFVFCKCLSVLVKYSQISSFQGIPETQQVVDITQRSNAGKFMMGNKPQATVAYLQFEQDNISTTDK